MIYINLNFNDYINILINFTLLIIDIDVNKYSECL